MNVAERDVEGVLRQIQRNVRNGASLSVLDFERQGAVEFRVNAAVELDIKLPSKLGKVFAFNNFVRIVSVRQGNHSLRRKAKRLSKSGLKAGNISSSIIAGEQTVGFER